MPPKSCRIEEPHETGISKEWKTSIGGWHQLPEKQLQRGVFNAIGGWHQLGKRPISPTQKGHLRKLIAGVPIAKDRMAGRPCPPKAAGQNTPTNKGL